MRQLRRCAWLATLAFFVASPAFADTTYTAPFASASSDGNCAALAQTMMCSFDKSADESGALHASGTASSLAGAAPGAGNVQAWGEIDIPITIPANTDFVHVSAHAVIDAKADATAVPAIFLGLNSATASIAIGDVSGCCGQGIGAQTFNGSTGYQGDAALAYSIDRRGLDEGEDIITVRAYIDIHSLTGGAFSASIDAVVDRVTVEIIPSS